MKSPYSDNDTIAALATAPGKGGVGIIRISGAGASKIAKRICRQQLKPRFAHYGNFYQNNDELTVLDQGIALFFPAPNSFTGEDVLELQGHGGPVIMDCLLQEVLTLGARLARPGEFSERAFLNDKIDLAQAEAIADLIDSSSQQAARNALRSLQGEFSRHIQILNESVIQLRIYVEAAIDFPEEEIDFLNDGKILNDLLAIREQLAAVFEKARQGALLREGMTVVIAGRPNAGKSSLLNALSGRETAIVTSIEGTTRDVLREHIQIDGMPLHIIDTAGLRESPDEIEQEGIRRAWQEIEQADRILLVVDSSEQLPKDHTDLWPQGNEKLIGKNNTTVILNKCDLSGLTAGLQSASINQHPVIALSAKNNTGIDALRLHLKNCMGYEANLEGGFSARRRHIQALEKARAYLDAGLLQLQEMGAGELLADDLRHCQQALNEITGEFTNDDLLGRIFSSFCIGK
jgi:tRNA modification GTPase